MEFDSMLIFNFKLFKNIDANLVRAAPVCTSCTFFMKSKPRWVFDESWLHHRYFFNRCCVWMYFEIDWEINMIS